MKAGGLETKRRKAQVREGQRKTKRWRGRRS